MDERSGRIYKNPSDEVIIEKQLTRLKNDEYDIVKDLPEEERPVMLALSRYLKERAKLGRTGVGIHERVAFRLGFKAGRESGRP
jgi:hypothetical protein